MSFKNKSCEYTKRISIAPMVDVTDRHFRYLCRLLTKKAFLYTEMITAPAIIRGDSDSLLSFNQIEKPLVLQIAGSNPDEIGEAIRIAEKWDYDEINLNVGCPSEKVSEYNMGLSLMKDPKLVAKIVRSMNASTKKPISVKHRLGVLESGENMDSPDIYKKLCEFIEIVSNEGVENFIIHARVGILGLDPKKNRSIPNIDYEMVYRVKEKFPNLNIEINGNIKDYNDIKKHLSYVDGVMLGRVSYENIMFLNEVDECISNKSLGAKIDEVKVVLLMTEYIKNLESQGIDCYNILKHLHSLFSGKKGSKMWKQFIGPPWDKNKPASEILKESLLEMKIKK